MKQATLQTDRLLLRPFLFSDAADIQRLAGNYAIADNTLDIPHPYEDGMAEAWISTHRPKFAAGDAAIFAIVNKANHQLVGAISLTIEAAFERAELGYWVGEPFWGQGLCTEAAKLVTKYGFEDLGLNRVHATHLVRNPASGRVLQKLGMSPEGRARQHTKKWDQYEDLDCYGLLRSDWQMKD